MRVGGGIGRTARPLAGACAIMLLAVAGVLALATPVAADTSRTARDVAYDGTRDGVDGSVYRLYRAFFLREPDADGLMYWLNNARYNDQSIAGIADNFTRSTEFRSRYGSVSNEGFIDLVYRNVMGRAPDPGGRAFWLDQLRRGMPRGHVMVHFSDSAEYGTKVGAGPFGRVDYRGPARTAPSAPAGTYAFEHPNPNGDGRPLGWAPCRPVYVALNPAGIPADHHAAFQQALRGALRDISDATRQDWVYIGRTGFRPQHASSFHGVRDLVTVGFAIDKPNTPSHGTQVVDSRPDLRTWRVVNTAAAVILSSDHTVGAQGLTPQTPVVIRHALAAVAGLSPVDDSRQVMFRDVARGSATAYASGDLAGLARVGSVTDAC